MIQSKLEQLREDKLIHSYEFVHDEYTFPKYRLSLRGKRGEDSFTYTMKSSDIEGLETSLDKWIAKETE
jgi:hypothetical protein